jgi:serine/threonine-protein kinase
LEGRSDIYSLGVILYELLCKRLPYNADTTITIWEMLRRVRHEEPIPPRQHVPAIPAQLEAICLKAMAKRVNDRYTTAVDLASDLRDLPAF